MISTTPLPELLPFRDDGYQVKPARTLTHMLPIHPVPERTIRQPSSPHSGLLTNNNGQQGHHMTHTAASIAKTKRKQQQTPKPRIPKQQQQQDNHQDNLSDVFLLMRQRDELVLRSHHLEKLLTDAEETITKQAKEIQVLRHAVAEMKASEASNAKQGEDATRREPGVESKVHEAVVAEKNQMISELLVTVSNLRSELSMTRERHSLELKAQQQAKVLVSPSKKHIGSTVASPVHMQDASEATVDFDVLEVEMPAGIMAKMKSGSVRSLRGSVRSIAAPNLISQSNGDLTPGSKSAVLASSTPSSPTHRHLAESPTTKLTSRSIPNPYLDEDDEDEDVFSDFDANRLLQPSISLNDRQANTTTSSFVGSLLDGTIDDIQHTKPHSLYPSYKNNAPSPISTTRIYKSASKDVLVHDSIDHSRSKANASTVSLKGPNLSLPDPRFTRPSPQSPLRTGGMYSAVSPSRHSRGIAQSVVNLRPSEATSPTPLNRLKSASQARFARASSPTLVSPRTLQVRPVTPEKSREQKSPDKRVLVRERDALEEELLLTYTQLRQVESHYMKELEKKGREVDELKSQVSLSGRQ